MINTGGVLRPRHLTILFGTMVVCFVLLTASVSLGSGQNGQIISSKSVADSNNPVEDINGPTVMLGYSKEEVKENPISSFMYFIPLISPTLVDNISSVNNSQQVGIISYDKKVTSKSFSVLCEFEMSGKGSHKNTFDSAGMIAAHIDKLKKGESMTHMLDYIKFEGEGFGTIEIKGTMAGSSPTITEVRLQFNARENKSPVTVGIYDVNPKDGVYKYENRSNKIVARVNTLSFKKAEKTPRMGIKVASISDTEESEWFFSEFKGVIVNLFINPPEVNEFGNATMLEFGGALLQKNPKFTFPKAKNIKESKIAKIDNMKKQNSAKVFSCFD